MNSTWSKEVFAKNLKRYMVARGKNQREMAEIVGVSAPTFNEWLKAKKYPRIDKVERLAQYFGIKKSDLIEEKITEDEKKDNSVMADIVIRMRTDKSLFEVVEKLTKLDNKKLSSINQLLDTFLE